MNFITILFVILMAISCKVRPNSSETLSGDANDIDPILESEYLNYIEYVKDERSLIGELNLDPDSQLRFFRNKSTDKTDRRSFIEKNFGPSDYMPNQNTLMFPGTGLVEEDLIGFVETFIKSELERMSAEKERLYGFKPQSKFDKKPTEVDVLFGYKEEWSELQKSNYKVLIKELGTSDKEAKDKKQNDSAPGFSNTRPVDGLLNESSGDTHSELIRDLFTPILVEVRGRLTKLSYINRENKLIIFQVFTYPNKTAFKIDIDGRESVLNEYHLFVRFLRDQNSDGLAKLLTSIKTPHLAEEQKTWDFMLQNRKTRPIKNMKLREFLSFSPPQNYTFIIPDFHESMFTQKLVELQLTQGQKKWDWIAIEAPLDCQSELDSQKFDANGCLGLVFDAATHKRKWSTLEAQQKFPLPTDHSIQVLLKAAFQNSIKVYFVDAAIKYKRGWSYKDSRGWSLFDLLAFKTRNWIMANRLPKQGRGILFAGAWHMNDTKDNVQDFLSMNVNPDTIGILALE